MTPEEFAAVIKNEGGKTATEEELTAFEQKIGASLPQRLRQFLKLSSGGLIFDPPVVYLDSQNRDLRLRHMSDMTEIDKEFTTPRPTRSPGNSCGLAMIPAAIRS